jgi:excinuclease ABC subunit C
MSPLDEITGVGPKRKMNLLRHFGDLEAVKNASVDEISEVQGVNKKLAIKIHDFLPQNTSP